MERIAVYTCITNAYDQLRKPPDWPGCDFICFTDNPYLRSTAWEVRRLPDDALDPARKSRLPKILPHKFLLEYPVSIWMDANATFNCDLAELVRKALKDEPALFFRHGERSTIYEEAEVCIRLGKDAAEPIERQIAAYREAGLPADAGLYECTVMARRHREPKVIRLMEAWWSELMTHSRRDQIGLPFAAWRSQFSINAIANRVPSSDQPIYARATHHLERRISQRRGAIKRSEMVVVSHPGSGRTWFQDFLVAYQHAAGDLEEGGDFGPGSLGGRGILFDHDYMDFLPESAEPPRLMYPRLMGKKRVVLLVCDPRLVVISHYHQKRSREQLAVGGLYDFVFSPIHGIERQSAFVNLLLDWYEAKKAGKLLLRFEKLRRNPARELRRFMHFVFPAGFDETAFGRAIVETDFKTLFEDPARSIEASDVFWPELWSRMSSLPNTRKLLQRLDYPE